jgi:hypothetical protein
MGVLFNMKGNMKGNVNLFSAVFFLAAAWLFTGCSNPYKEEDSYQEFAETAVHYSAQNITLE